MERPSLRRPLDSASGLRLLSGVLAFGAGIAGHWPAAFSLATLSGIVAFFCRPRLAAGLALPIWFAVGAAVAATHEILDPLPPLMRAWQRAGFEERATPLEMEGRVLDLETLPRDRLALTLRLDRWRLPAQVEQTPAGWRPVRLRLTAPLRGGAPIPWIEGDRVRLTARVGIPRSFRNPASFDYAAYLAARGVHLTGTVKSLYLVERIERSERFSWWRGALPSLRRMMISNLHRAAGRGGDSTPAFLAALLLGERQSLPPRLEEALVQSGVYHIVALSGLNVGLIILLASGALALLPIGGRWRRIALLLAVLLYWGTVRHGGSIARASLMVLIHLTGSVAGRRVASLGALPVSAFLLLAWRPAWMLDAGFQLSYAATLGLMSIIRARSPAGSSRIPIVSWSRRLIAASFRASGAALLATAPLMARHFHALAPAGLLANLVAVPIAALALVMALVIAATASWAPGVAIGASEVSHGMLRLLERTASACAAIPGGFLFVLPPSIPLLATLSTALAIFGLARRNLTRRAAAAAALVLALALVFAGRSPRAPGRLEVTALDVGQGDAVLTRFPNGLTLLSDAGGVLHGDFDLGARVVAPALRGLGLLRIDILAITHAHRDHLGGATSVLRQLRPGALWLGAMPSGDPEAALLVAEAEAAGVPVVRPRRGVRLTLGGGRLEVLHPAAGESVTPQASNADSLVLRIAAGRRAVLLTGDAESGVEREITSGVLDPAAELLKVAHHGSASSTSDAFLHRVGPRVALVSVGLANPFHHPSEEVIERLRRRGVRVLRTDRDGAVGAWTDGRGPWQAAPLLAPTAGLQPPSEDARCGGDEAEDEDDQADEGDEMTARGQRRDIVQGSRVAGSQDREQDSE